MQTKKTIAIIGATGQMGSALAKSLSKGNYRLLLMAKNIDKLNSLLNSIKQTNSQADIDVISCPVDACWEADIIINAVPYLLEKEIAPKIKQVATGKVVISITNPFNETYTALVTAADTSAAEELQKLLPDSKVTKAFNTTFAANFSEPAINGLKVVCFIAGDDEEAVQTVSEVVETAGFHPVLAGNLAASRTLEQMQALLVLMQQRYHYPEGSWKIIA